MESTSEMSPVIGRLPGMTRELRGRLDAFADVLFPSKPPLPSASDTGLGTAGIDLVLAANPELAEPVIGLLDCAGDGDPREELIRLRERDPAGYAQFVLAVCSAYYMVDEVRAAIGYPGQVPVLRTDLPGVDLEDPLLAPVLARGSIYREVT